MASTRAAFSSPAPTSVRRGIRTREGRVSACTVGPTLLLPQSFLGIAGEPWHTHRSPSPIVGTHWYRRVPCCPRSAAGATVPPWRSSSSWPWSQGAGARPAARRRRPRPLPPPITCPRSHRHRRSCGGCAAQAPPSSAAPSPCRSTTDTRTAPRLPLLSPGPRPSIPPDGTLVFNPGGPGESGNQILPVALSLLPPAIRQDFDIVTFDPRGTGASDPLRCGTPPSALTSADPVPAAPGRPLPGSTAFTTMARSCRAEAPDLEPFIDTTDTARDMDRIRQSLGLATISFYGISYGTVLGTVYAELFPHRVATMVLDGAVDINASLTRQAIEEAPVAEQALAHLFATS